MAPAEFFCRCFAGNDGAKGCRKNAQVSVAKIELEEGDEAERREARVLRQRQANDVIDRLLARIG